MCPTLNPASWPPAAGERLFKCVYCRHWCCSYPCRHIPWSNCESTVGRHLGGLWHGKEFQVLSHQRHLCKPGGATITSITCVPRIFRLRYNLCLQRKGQEISLAGLAGLWRRHRNIRLSCRTSLPATESRRRPFPEVRETDCYPVWQNQSFELCQWDKKGTLLSEESSDGQTTTHQRCTTPACPTCSVSSRHLDVQHRGTTSGSVSTGFCLDQRVRLVGTSLGDNSRGFQVVQRANQMRLQRGLLQLQMWQSKSGLLTTLQVQLLTACNRCLYLLAWKLSSVCTI